MPNDLQNDVRSSILHMYIECDIDLWVNSDNGNEAENNFDVDVESVLSSHRHTLRVSKFSSNTNSVLSWKTTSQPLDAYFWICHKSSSVK